MTAVLLLATGVAAGYGYYRARTDPLSTAPDGRIASGQPQAQPDGGTVDPIEVLPFDGEIFDSAGTRDFKNKYLATVIVSPQEPLEEADCSGVIIKPKVVLTAAHCVCKPARSSSSEKPTALDNTNCSAQAYAATVRYGTVRSKMIADFELRIHSGTVRPHPEFKMVLDQSGAVLSINADLAFIFLNEPVEGQFEGVPLADAEIQDHEDLVMAGYSHGEDMGGGYEDRYFRSNKVIGPEEPLKDRFLYEQQGSYIFNGFAGGPCFRERDGTLWLAGIASVGSDEKLSLTSTFSHRAWIRSEIQRVSQ